MEVRYERSFIADLQHLESTAYRVVYNFVFDGFLQNPCLHCMPALRQIDDEGRFHRFTLDNYLIGIEVRGEIIKFLRVIPIPGVKSQQTNNS